MSVNADPAVSDDDGAEVPFTDPQTAAYKRYLLVVLILTAALNYIDRISLSLLMQDIKTDLDLSDTQLGFLTGLAFTVFYVVVGMPLARWADRGDRVTLLSITTALFGCAVTLSGVAISFIQLIFLRIFAGVGESGTMPTALSLISESFSREERPRAVSRYMLSLSLAQFIGFFCAGWLCEYYGWRITVLFLGTPAIGLAVLIYFTLREPRRQKAQARNAETVPTKLISAVPTYRHVVQKLWQVRSYRYIVFAMALNSFVGFGVSQWQPAFFVRSYGLSVGQLGTWLAIVYAATGFLGTWLGGDLAVRFASGNEHRQLAGVAILFCLLAVAKPLVYIMPSYQWAFTALSIVSLLSSMANGPMYAAVQTLVPSSMRATAMAFILLCANLVGAGLGPLLVGALSDIFHARYGSESLRYVLIVLSPLYMFAGAGFFMASRCRELTLDEEVELGPVKS